MKSGFSKTYLILLIAILAVCLIVAAGVGTYSAYTSSRSAQRTIATYDEHGQRFSSNILVPGNSKDNVKTLYVTDASVAPSQVVTLGNYERGKQNLPNAEEISYTLTARFVKYDSTDSRQYVPVDESYMTSNSLTGYQATVRIGNRVVTLSSSHVSDSTYTGTLTANEPDSDSYTLTFGTNFAGNQPNLYVEMIAVPNIVGLQQLCGVFKTGVRAQGAADSWSGSFSDDTATAPSGYDGFNYMITGVGSGTVTLAWDDTKVGLSYYSLQSLLSIDGVTQTGSSISFPVDSGTESRYDLQFYKVNITTETWGNMNTTVVRFSFS